MSKYYLYRHIRPDLNIPFYIGIGTRNEKLTHKGEYERAYVFYCRSVLWTRIYNKNDKNISVDILFESDSFKEIVRKEMEFIKLYGRINLGTGHLVNLTDGGEGNVNCVVTQSHREKISKGLLALNLK